MKMVNKTGATMLAVALACSTLSPVPAHAGSGYFGGGADQFERAWTDHGPRVPDHFLEKMDRMGKGVQRFSDHFERAYPMPSIRKRRIGVGNPLSGLFRPSCVGEDC